MCATWWTATFVTTPSTSLTGLLRESTRRAWQQPERTLLTWLLTLLAALVGAISIGGLILIVPVFIAILHTHQVHACGRP
ncbi:DUF202 domain-containing protein [Tenggerimyces flavus]|uniref:DUF202 domain-containing protein n=1 Tax=Tenggerimyces flavus TaxID=1708749 RepID=A0ABV7YS38_9ACTN|nr:DUF202 domain-containing protein [Tenggerimyces flavus]MBM7790119.1 uncharacterized membrane protein YidH (DUF202 family) [Tenggerimyces flavus]